MTMKIGMGLAGVGGYALGANLGYGTQEQPFLNLFKACNGWRGIGNITARQYTFDHMNLDGNGYPTNKNIISPSGRDTTFSYFRATIFFENGWYDYNSASFINGGPAGRYVILWSGPGKLTLAPGSDGTYTSVATGRAFVDVRSPSGAGIILQNDARTVFNAVTNVRVVYSPDAATGAGGSTTPGVNVPVHMRLY